MFELFREKNEDLLTERVSFKKIETKNTQNKYQNNEKTVLSILKSLSEEEIGLTSEKNQLLDMEKLLKKRIVNEIEIKKTRISDLQIEIPKLKQRIEDLATILEIPIVK